MAAEGLEVTVNGTAHTVTVTDRDTPLLDVLRHGLRLCGPKFGCGAGLCGACRVLIDGRARSSCDVPAWQVRGASVVTVEGLAANGARHAVQQAFLDEQAAQCGYCTAGMLVSAAALLAANPAPSRADVVAALEPNLCRCGIHNRAVRAVLRAAAALAEPTPAQPARVSGDLPTHSAMAGLPVEGGGERWCAAASGPAAADADAPAASAPAPAALLLPAPGLPGTLAAHPVLAGWLDFSRPGEVAIATGKVELGQGVWTALAQVAAEELDIGLDRVRVMPVSTRTSPDEGTTSGSRSIEVSGRALRQACAQARLLLLATAARRLGTVPAGLAVVDGQVCRDGRASGLSYWSLAASGLLARQAVTPVPEKPPGEWSVAGHSAPRLDLPAKVTGQPSFLHDLVLPGMVYGRVVRPPSRGAHLAGLPAAGLPDGVTVVRHGSFLGVMASDDWSAVRAARSLARVARWTGAATLPDEDDLATFLLTSPAQTQTVVSRAAPEQAAPARRTLTSQYTRPFLAHASMAPSCGAARWDGAGGLTVWSSSQGVFALRDAVAAALGLDAGAVTVHHVPGAGCYGHNGADDAAFDAVLLARAVPGTPVSVTWTRADEMGWAPLGPAMLARLSAGLDSQGKVVTWHCEVWSNGFLGRPGNRGEPRLLGLAALPGGEPLSPAWDGPPDGTIGATRNAVPGYDIPDMRVVRHRLTTMPLHTSSLRSLGAFLNVFAIESFMDELAAAAGADPVSFRLAHLADPRARRVVAEVARAAGWPARRRPEGTGYGIGYARYKGTAGYCAAVAEVTADTEVAVRRLWLAVDVGRVINPDGVISQVEGGAVQATSWVLRERVRFDRAAVTSLNWDSYPILRFSEVPEVSVRLVGTPGDPESGAGELAHGPVAGAIGNAVADALGVRVRDLPFTRGQVERAIAHA